MMHSELASIRIRAHTTRLLARHGEHEGHLRERGMELDELSEYVSGDPLHSINWRATARSRTPIVNRFHPTQQMNLHLIYALSGSMLFGQPPKHTLAVELLSALGYAALLQRDRLRVTLFDDRPRWELRPTRRPGVTEAIHAAASTLDLHRKQIDYTALEHYVMSTLKHPSVLFILGDFLTLPALEALAGRHELHLITIRDPQEETPTLRGRHRLLDPLSGETHSLHLTRRTAAAYTEQMAAHNAALDRWCRTHRVDRVTIRTGEDAIATLAEHLRRQG